MSEPGGLPGAGAHEHKQAFVYRLVDDPQNTPILFPLMLETPLRIGTRG